jgi:hypothetical protein
MIAFAAQLLIMDLRYAQRIENEYRMHRKCSGYTILDADHIVTCDGDTIQRGWQPLKRNP